MLNVFYFRLKRKGYPRNDYIASTFSMVCNAANQFESAQPTPQLKFLDSGNPKFKALEQAEFSDLQECIDAVKAFMTNGPNPNYVYDNFRAGGSGTRGTVVGHSRFWLSHVGKDEYDAIP